MPAAHLRPEPSSPAPADATQPDPSKDIFASLEPYLSPAQYGFISQNVGLVFVALAQFFFASMNITVKYFLTITPISVTTLIFVRMFITSLGCVLALRFIVKHPHALLGPPEIRTKLLLRGVAGLVGLYAAYKSYEGLSVSDATTIAFLTPSITAILGWVILGEKLALRELAAGAACLGGVLLVSRPPMLFGQVDQEPEVPPAPGSEASGTTRMQGVAWALLGVCGASAAYLLIRTIGQKAHALHTMSYFAYLCTIVTFVISLFSAGDTIWVKTKYQFFLVCLIGIFGFAGQILLTMGLQRERVGRAGIALYLGVFFAIVLELVVFHTFPAFLSLCGITVILLSAYWVAASLYALCAGSSRADRQQSKQEQAAKERDPEARPCSPNPSPDQSPRPGGTARSNSYMSLKQADDEDEASSRGTNVNGGLLKAHPYPGSSGLKGGRQRSESQTSSIR